MLLSVKLISRFVVEYLAGLIIDNGSQVSRVLRAVNITDGCLCVMFKYSHAYHVGIYADGTVFHCVEGRGVLGTSVQKTLTLGYEKIEFYDNKEMPWL